MPNLSRACRRAGARAGWPGALAAALALTAASCAGASGPLGEPAGGTKCVTAAQGTPVTVGLIDLRNHARSPVTVRAVALAAPHNLRITAAWLLPGRRDGVTVGAGAAWPPSGAPGWGRRVAAAGGVIAPGQDVNLVFGVARVADKNGLTAGETIGYSSGARDYTLTDALEVVVSRKC